MVEVTHSPTNMSINHVGEYLPDEPRISVAIFSTPPRIEMNLDLISHHHNQFCYWVIIFRFDYDVTTETEYEHPVTKLVTMLSHYIRGQ